MNPVTGLSLARIALGAAALARPVDAGTLFGLDVKANPQLPYVTRLFGAREVALGLITLAATGRARTGIVLIGVAVDAADAATGYLGPQEGQVSQQTGLRLTAVAAGAVLGGLAGLRVKSPTVVV